MRGLARIIRRTDTTVTVESHLMAYAAAEEVGISPDCQLIDEAAQKDGSRIWTFRVCKS